MFKGSSKFVALTHIIQEEGIRNDKKLLIFSGFNYALDCVESLLTEMGISYVRLDGNTSYGLRKYNIFRFQKKDEYKVFIMATRAGGEGITLTRAEVVVFLDSDWNPQVTAQAEARTWRLGQLKPVTVYKLFTERTVEEQMEDRLNKKIFLTEKLLKNASSANWTTIDDISQSDSDLIQELIQRSRKALQMSRYDAGDLSFMNWDEFLSRYQRLTNNGPCLSRKEHSTDNRNEFLWLTTREKVKTQLFDGQLFKRQVQTKRQLITNADHIGKRAINPMRIWDESIGYWISKESSLCQFGQAIPTLTTFERPPAAVKNSINHFQVS